MKRDTIKDLEKMWELAQQACNEVGVNYTDELNDIQSIKQMFAYADTEEEFKKLIKEYVLGFVEM